ncbi:hypothetical protein DFR58_101112 [Anaerobacterium chartisolvens]|uniref:Uncharacterized protein n=1 Tax=Anaerobacterium chartisolvens TaxID=1297424 RepID=A0A369BH80_9FIRM|nr:hypothetical protein [Anaerobacterium chartisolvens]RCX20910.1 hypothetical protein DFR58_101112 [Anaerobacterium chartisolvens]
MERLATLEGTVILPLREYEALKQEAEKLEELRRDISKCSEVEVTGTEDSLEGTTTEITVDKAKILAIAADYSLWGHSDLDWLDTADAVVTLKEPEEPNRITELLKNIADLQEAGMLKTLEMLAVENPNLDSISELNEIIAEEMSYWDDEGGGL